MIPIHITMSMPKSTHSNKKIQEPTQQKNIKQSIHQSTQHQNQHNIQPIQKLTQQNIKQSAQQSTQQPTQHQQPSSITISQILRKFPTKSSQLLKTQTHYNHQALRQSQINKYAVQVFSYLNLQTKKQLQPQTQNKPQTDKKYSIPHPKNRKYLMQMPQTCKSVVKIQQPQSQIYYNDDQIGTPTLKVTKQHQQQNKGSNNNKNHNNNNNRAKSHHVKMRLDINDILQVQQSQFQQNTINNDNDSNQNNSNHNNHNVNPKKPSTTPSNKNKRVIKNKFDFQSIQNAPDNFYQPQPSPTLTSNINPHPKSNTIKRGSNNKQIKTFNIGNIQQKKQSDFGGCCGFNIVSKISFLSKDY